MSQELTEFITNVLQPLHYEVVSIEVQKRQKKLRIFIDRSTDDRQSTPSPRTPIGIEDCIQVTKALDEPLEQFPLMTHLFDGTYELEVSSPGVERPLAQPLDYEKFRGSRIRVHTFRPLIAQEIGNAAYLESNSKQKNFVGTLDGIAKGEPQPFVKMTLESNHEIQIPLELISKAHLEPKWDELSSELSSRKHDRRKGTPS